MQQTTLAGRLGVCTIQAAHGSLRPVVRLVQRIRFDRLGRGRAVGRVHLARLARPRWRADDAGVFQRVHQPRGAGVTDAKAALQEGRGRLVERAHQGDGLRQEVVVLAVAVARLVVHRLQRFPQRLLRDAVSRMGHGWLRRAARRPF